mgnify:CR=1 FL=1
MVLMGGSVLVKAVTVGIDFAVAWLGETCFFQIVQPCPSVLFVLVFVVQASSCSHVWFTPPPPACRLIAMLPWPAPLGHQQGAMTHHQQETT